MRNKNILILTNNPLIDQESERLPFQVLYYKRNLEEMVEKGVKLRKKGYWLCADPLGGYHFRYNPYHTFFFHRQPKDNMRKEQIYLIEKILWKAVTDDILKWEQMEKKEKGESMLKDYQVIDESIAQGTIQVLLGEKS